MDSLIHIDRIQVNCLVKDQFDAIALAAKPLLEKGFITEEFIDAAIERERIFPTGLPTKIGAVFYPILRLKYVLNESISILTLKNTIVFAGMGNPESIPVQIVFLLAISNPEKQLRILQTIITIIQNEKMLKK